MDINDIKGYISNIEGDIKNFPDDKFREFCSKIYEFGEFTKELNRPSYKEIPQIASKISKLGACIEAAEILYNDHKFYLKKNDYVKAYCESNKIAYFGVLEANCAFFIDFLDQAIKDLQNRDKLELFLARLLNIKGAYLGLIKEDYIGSRKCICKAIKIANKVPVEEFEKFTNFHKNSYISLLWNNYADAGLHILYDTGYNKELVEEIFKNIENFPSDEEYFYIVYKLTLAELYSYLHKNREKEKIFKKLLVTTKNKEFIRWIKIVKKRIKAISFYLAKNYQTSLKMALEYFISAVSRNELLEVQVSTDFYFNLLLKIYAETKSNAFTYKDQKILIDNIMILLEKRDWYLGKNHSKSVQSLSIKMGNRMNLGQEKGQILSIGALFHDIGKICIPWYTLNKTSPLSNIDWALLKSHCKRGEQLLNILNLQSSAVIAREHHERIDGSGYPEGLKEIDDIIQIVAIADSFEAAITPNRRYRKPISKEAIRGKLISMSGHKFDKDIIDIFKTINIQHL